MLAYIAHPIDQRVGDSWLDLTQMQLAATLAQIGCASYWPDRPFTVNNRSLEWAPLKTAIGKVNETAQKECAITVAIIPDDTPTLGTAAEIERALQWGQPVAIIAGPKVRNGIQYAEWIREGAIEALAAMPGEAIYKALEEHVQLETTNIQVKLGTGTLPNRHYSGDAGYDLYVSEDCLLGPGKYADIQCGFELALPPGVWGLLIGRSSTAQRGLVVNTVVIDQGYVGPMYVGVTNVGEEYEPIWTGERLAQVVPMPLLAGKVGIEEVEELPETDRGSKGRGSTGA